MSYRGRFAPSPTGPLHAGSVVAALASWLDARAHGGVWLVRMEDVDTPRCSPHHAQTILAQLSALGMHSDEPVWWQSKQGSAYGSALAGLVERSMAYGCACSRADVAAANAAMGLHKPRFGELVYPGTCRAGLRGRTPSNWRFDVGGAIQTANFNNFGVQNDFYRQNMPFVQYPRHFVATQIIANDITWRDRALGVQRQNTAAEVGDFVLKRADGLWAYQLAVVVDDAAQGITHVVRGQDLADNTPRQILLQSALGLATPSYLHTPLVLGADGHKLAKQNGAQAVAADSPGACLTALRDAASQLGLPEAAASATTQAELLHACVGAWAAVHACDN